MKECGQKESGTHRVRGLRAEALTQISGKSEVLKVLGAQENRVRDKRVYLVGITQPFPRVR
jgi:hypothetical protein